MDKCLLDFLLNDVLDIQKKFIYSFFFSLRIISFILEYPKGKTKMKKSVTRPEKNELFNLFNCRHYEKQGD